MRTGMFAMAAGIVWVGFWPALPDLRMVLALVLVLAGLACLLTEGQHLAVRICIVTSCLLAGASWHVYRAESLLELRLPTALQGQDLLATGYVATIPEQTPTGQRFQFVVEQSAALRAGSRLMLNSFGSPQVDAGQRWQLLVRLKQPHGSANPGTFDYEAWLFQQGIGARGYVRTGGSNQQLTGTSSWWLSMRAAIHSRLVDATQGLSFQAVLLAVTLGDRNRLTEAHWETFTQTGTNHLVVISGLHVMLVAALVAWLAGRLWRCSARLLLWLPAQQAGALAAIVGALLYSSISGFGLPAQRAVIMVVVFVLTQLLATRSSNWFSLQLALLAVLLIDPMAATGAGFWLSFMAVAALLSLSTINRSGRIHTGDEHSAMASGNNGAKVCVQGLSWRKVLLRYVAPQLGVFVGLLVPLGYWQGEVSLLAPLANLIAIPVVGWLVVPLALSACLLLPVCDRLALWLLGLADQIFGMLYRVLDTLVQVNLIDATWPVNTVSIDLLILASLGSLLLLLPGYGFSRVLGVALLLPLLGYGTGGRNDRLLELHVLDVGQGLAMIVRTGSHTLVYDTGPRFSSGFDSGSAVVWPVLKQFGVRQVDTLIVSHGDNDHAGGVRGLLESVPVQQMLAGEPLNGSSTPRAEKEMPGSVTELTTLPCQQGREWHWDGVDFAIIHPAAVHTYRGNNSSCVLLISAGSFQVLLPGDIEASVERSLLGKLALADSLDVLVSAHHGSNTSSSLSLLLNLDARLVIHSAGYRNQFGHPTDKVTERFARLGARQLSTADSGMISILLHSVGDSFGGGSKDGSADNSADSTRNSAKNSTLDSTVDRPGDRIGDSTTDSASPLFSVRRYREDHRRYWHWQQAAPAGPPGRPAIDP